VQRFKISVNTKYCKSAGELIREFLLSKQGDTLRIINNICLFLQAVTRPIEVECWYLNKPSRGLSHLLLVNIVDTTVLRNNEVIAQQN
jgi:hypothetical protein